MSPYVIIVIHFSFCFLNMNNTKGNIMNVFTIRNNIAVQLQCVICPLLFLFFLYISILRIVQYNMPCKCSTYFF